MQKTNYQKRQQRPLHRRIALHPFSLLVVMCVGVVLTMSTIQVNAETLQVSATVPAPLPSAPAIITSPQDQDRVTADTINVIGTCPADSAYVELYRNNLFSGVGQCTGGGFLILTSLSVGANELQARVFNFTNNEGPVSSPITVFRDVPPQAPPAPSPPPDLTPSPLPSTPGIAPLVANIDYQYQTHFINGAFEWRLQVQGGVRPYIITINWKDGTTSEVRSNVEGEIILKHAYASGGVFEPIVTIADAQGVRTLLQLVAFVKELPTLGVNSSILTILGQYLWIMWPAYAVVTLMIISFWLGEREIIRRLSSSSRRRKNA